MWNVVFLIQFLCLFISCTQTGVLILARGGSKSVYLKNLKNVGGVSLVCRAVTVAKSAGLHDVTVSTDHPLIALEANKCNATTFHRSPITASDWAPSIWGAQEFLHHRPDIDILILIQATSPFIQSEQLQNALKIIGLPISFDCIFTVTRSYKLRWHNKGDKLKPLNFNILNRPRRQNWSGELLETGAFYVTRKSLIINSLFQNFNCSVVEVPHIHSLEIDSYEDLHIANALLEAGLAFSFSVTSISYQIKMAHLPNIVETVTFEELEATDVITVELVPERKGLILKHCEYYVSSRRHGTTVTRRYNEFAQLYEILYAKYPYRAICRLPPKRVVVGGGSPHFLQRRRVALQRWLILMARHPVLAHDADLRMFLCEITPKLDKPKHDEFVLAGTQDTDSDDLNPEDMQATYIAEQEHLRLIQLGLNRMSQIFERVENRYEAEMNDIRELGAALHALAAPPAPPAAPAHTPRWSRVKLALAAAAQAPDWKLLR